MEQFFTDYLERLQSLHEDMKETIKELPQAALDWVRRRDPSRPYLLRVSFNAPHTPVVTPAPYDTMIDPETIDLPIDTPDTMEVTSRTHRDYLVDYAGTQRLTDAQIRRARQCYYGQVAFVDHAFGRLLDTLQEMGELENTVIAYVSDHGAHLGDYGFFQKQSFWEAAVRVPFFLAGPGIHQAADPVSTPVNVGSLLPTLMDLAGIAVPEDVQYPSLAPALRNGTAIEPQPVFSEIDFGIWHYRLGDRCVMIRDGRWKLSLFRDPREPYRFAASEDRVLYDLETDPQERHNLASDLAYAQVIDELVFKIDEWDRARPVTPPSLIAGYQH